MKFKLGQKVKIKNDEEVGEVLSVHVNNDGILYTISSREVDLAKKSVVLGVKNCMEDELEEVK